MNERETIALMTNEIAAAKLYSGFMRYLQNEEGCPETGQNCLDKSCCACFVKLQHWCKT